MESTDCTCPTGSDDLDYAAEIGDGSGGELLEADADNRSPGCPNCGTQNYASEKWCRYCGYYALLGRCVELDESERQVERDENAEETEEEQSIWQRIPPWAYQLVAVLIGVAAVSVAGRFLTYEESTPRLIWTLGQVVGGVLAFLVAHFFMARTAMAQNATLSVTDAIMSPTQIWIAACLDFQNQSRWISIGLAGIWGTILAHVLLGVPYGKMFTHEEPPAKKKEASGNGSPNGVGNGKKDMTMEEAMDEFADQAGAEKADKKENAEPRGTKEAGSQDEEANQPNIKELDCLIVGYRLGEEGTSVSSLVVAVQSGGQWNVVGTVADGLTPEIQSTLIVSAKALHRERPFVECKLSAVWLEPVLRCRIEAEYPVGQDEPSKLTLLKLQ